ncbi:MAG: hypothetical protein EXS48_03565 [Candidatus Staskawiczbacteria bacterium]|nr:hypothetical protein [Candidatus Staskawiczbacteria bacterium]
MVKDFFIKYIYPTAIFTGSIIGVGFLSLPYITLKVGIWPMLFYFIFLTIVVISIHIIFAKISLKTPDYKRFPGFVGHHLGKFPKKIILVSETCGLTGVLLVYLIIGGEFLTVIFSPIFGGNVFTYTIIYLGTASIFIYVGAKIISRMNFLALLALVVILGIILVKAFDHLQLANIFTGQALFTDYKTLFLPYGAIMFSLWGCGLIPEVEEMVIGNKKSLKKIIIAGTLISSAFYFSFILVILSITGAGTTEAGLTGLTGILPYGLVTIALSIGAITTLLAFIAQGLLLKKVLMYDTRVPELPAWALVCFVPLGLFLMGFNSFIPLISFIGGFLLSIDGILILLMYKKIGGKKMIVYPLMLVFLLGMAYEIIYFVK